MLAFVAAGGEEPPPPPNQWLLAPPQHTETHTQKLVKTGSLYPAKVILRATSVVPLGGLPVAGLNRRPYFACCGATQTHIKHLSSYWESTWALCMHTHRNAHRPYVYRQWRSEQEVEEVHLQRALREV